MSDQSNGLPVKRRLRCRSRRSGGCRSRVPMSRRGCNSNPFQRKVKTLKKLIRNKEAVGLAGLFRETAEYILCLQMRVKVMQVMVKVLAGPDV